MWSNVLERSQNSFTKTLTKPLWYGVNLVRHTNSLLNGSEAKCANRQQERLTLCLKLLPQSLECWIGTCLYQETLGKIYSFEDNDIFKLAQLNRKETERQEGVHGYLSWWLGTSLWPCDKTKIASDWASGGESKTHQMLAGTTQGGIPIILC